MSIHAEIIARGTEGRLFRLLPAVQARPVVRTMLLSAELNGVIFGQWPNVNERIRMAQLRRDLDRFVEGGIITVAAKPYKAGAAYLSRLDRAADEVWEIRSRHPKPGIRVFGRFAELDTFVALTWSLRGRLGGPTSLEWKDAIRECKAIWRQLFPT